MKGWWWDTMLMHHCLDPSDDHDLAYCASCDTREPFWKHESKSPDEMAGYASNMTSFLIYNGKDCCVTRELVDVYRQRLVDQDLHNFYLGYYPPLFQPLLDLTRHGIRVEDPFRHAA